MPARAVFDTNVLLSGVGWRGAPFRCLELARAGLAEGVTCKEILAELAATLKSKMMLSDADVAAILIDLLSFLEPLEIAGTLTRVALSPKDDMVLECAVVAHADYIVTGDRRHLLPLRSYEGIAIVSPGQFLDSALRRSAEGTQG